MVSKRVRDLADVVLHERFVSRWSIKEVVAPPAAAPAFAAARPAAFVLCHKLRGKESLASLAVKYGTDVVALKRLNNMLSDGALFSRWTARRVVCLAGSLWGSWCPVAHQGSPHCRLQGAPVCAGGRCGCRGGGQARGIRGG